MAVSEWTLNTTRGITLSVERAEDGSGFLTVIGPTAIGAIPDGNDIKVPIDQLDAYALRAVLRNFIDSA